MLTRHIAALLTVFMFAFTAPVVSYAAIPEEELSIYLEDIGWTRDVMELYIDRASHGTKTLASFHSLDDLVSYLGARTVDEQALQALLDKYGYTKEDVNLLLAKYNTNVDEYTFITELDLDMWDILAEQSVTENGGQLPATAGGYALYTALGLLLAVCGMGLLYKGLVRGQ